MTIKFQFQQVPITDPVVDPAGGFRLTWDWENWFHRLPDVVLKRPSCHVYRATAQTISTATQTDMLWTDEEHDNADMHDTSSNTDRITIPEDGVYCFGAHLLWAANATGFRQLLISLNDPSPVATAAGLVEDAMNANAFPSNFGRNFRSGKRRLSAGDILRVAVQQTSGGDLTVADTTTNGPRAGGFWCHKVSK